MTTKTATEETAKAWYERELQFAEDAHEIDAALGAEIVSILIDERFGKLPNDDQYARAAQLIACRRNTCGGPNAAHKHIA